MHTSDFFFPIRCSALLDCKHNKNTAAVAACLWSLNIFCGLIVHPLFAALVFEIQ